MIKKALPKTCNVYLSCQNDEKMRVAVDTFHRVYNGKGNILIFIRVCHLHSSGPEVIKLFHAQFNSVEHEILNAHKYKNIKEIQLFPDSDKPRMLFFLLINVKMPTIVGILTFMSRKNFMLNCIEHEKSFITSGPVFQNWLDIFMK